MILLTFATVVACNFRDCKYLLVEPETTVKSCLAEYEVAMRKLQMLSIIKSIRYCTNAEQRSKVNANNEAEVIDLLHGFKDQHKKCIELFDEYLSSVVIQNVSNDDSKPVKSNFLLCLKSFPASLDFFSFLENFYSNKKMRMSDLICYCCIANYDKCLMEFIFHRMQKILSKREDLIEIWHRLIRQIYLDTMYTQKLHEWSDSQDSNVNAIEVNAPIFCIKSKDFFKDTIDYINNIAQSQDNVEGINVVYDISPLLVLHFIKYAKKEPNTIKTPLFSEELLIDVISYLTTEKKYIKSLEPISMPKIKHLAFSGYPNELTDISDILSVAKIDVREYQKCFKAALAFAHIHNLSNEHFSNNYFSKVTKRGGISLKNLMKLHLDFYTREIEQKYMLLRITARICEGLTVELICGGVQPFTEFASIEVKNFEHYDVFNGPMNQSKIKKLYKHIARIKIEDVQEEEDVELDFSLSFVTSNGLSASSLASQKVKSRANEEKIKESDILKRSRSRRCRKVVKPQEDDQRHVVENSPWKIVKQTENDLKEEECTTSFQITQSSMQQSIDTKSRTVAYIEKTYEAPKSYAGESKARTKRSGNEGGNLRRAKNKVQINMLKEKSMTKDEVMCKYISLEAKYTAVAEDLITARTVLEKADTNVINARIDLERSKLDLDRSMSDLKNTRSAVKIAKAVVDVKKAKAVLSDATKKFEYSILDKKIALEAIELCEQRQIKILSNAAHFKAEETAFFEQCSKDQLTIINQNSEVCHDFEDTCNPKNDAMSQKEDEMLVNSSNPTDFAKTAEWVEVYNSLSQEQMSEHENVK